MSSSRILNRHYQARRSLMTVQKTLRGLVFTAAFGLIISTAANAETAAALKSKLASASSSIQDLQGTMVVKSANRSNAGEISKGVSSFLDQGFREAKIWFKRPNKFRAQGKAKGIDVTYVLDGNKKQITAPALMLKKNENLSDDREKKQSTLDLGFASDLLWNDNKVKVLSTDSKGIAKVQLIPIGVTDKRKELVWIDTKSLEVIQRERYGGGGNLKWRHVYKAHKMMGKVPVATLVHVYSPDGGYVGAIVYSDLRVNTRLRDSLFAVK